nr:hypothetical protein [uncultured Methanoregula sp.]
MKKTSIIAVLAAAILVAGIFIAGCTQDAGSSSVTPVTSQQYSSPGMANSQPAGNGGSQSGSYAGNRSGTGGNRQFSGQSLLSNETRLSAAATKLGVQEQDLKNALTATTNATSGRPDLSAAAQQLGVTQQQLTDALGFPAGGIRGNRTGGAATPGSGQ